jgi:hypothetical protein
MLLNRCFSRAKLLIILFLLIAILGVYAAPRFLRYADKPVRSDVVILFVGPGLEDRLLEARQLVRDGFADALIIPAYQAVFERLPDGRIESVGSSFIDQFTPTVRPARQKLPTYYEATHVEAFEAKRLMDLHGYRSALFVSSPYHMRRIRLISKEVFNSESYAVRFVPSRYEAITHGTVRMEIGELRWLATEYAKIGWLLAYSMFE